MSKFNPSFDQFSDSPISRRTRKQLKLSKLGSYSKPAGASVVDASVEGSSVEDISVTGTDTEDIELRVINQPPSKCVYNRVLKPWPKVEIVGSTLDYLTVAVSVVRSNDQTIDKYLLAGITEVNVSKSSAIFKRLKLTKTSHQENNTLFFLKFDLVKTNHCGVGVKARHVLCTTYSNPIEVFSHSSLLRQSRLSQLSPFPPPEISEIIPPYGSDGDRVAILGQNFLPNQLVQFGSVPVVPDYITDGTLVCSVPPDLSDLFGVLHCGPNTKIPVCVHDYYHKSDTCAAFHYIGKF